MNVTINQLSPQQIGEAPKAEGNGVVRYKIPSTRRLVPRASERRSKMIAFGYYGGKFSHLQEGRSDNR
jgi:hypothetical protein